MTRYLSTITTTADLIASVPALLGFTPERSHVVIGLTVDETIAFTARIDIVGFDRRVAENFVDALTHTHSGATAVVLLAVASGDVAAALRGQDRLVVAAGHAGFGVLGTFLVEDITAGARFTDRDTGDDGVVTDPRSTEEAAAAVESGRVLAHVRADLEAEFAEADEVPLAIGFRLAAADRHGEDMLADTLFELALTVIGNWEPTDDLVAMSGVALSGGAPDVRAAFLRLPIFSVRHAATVMTTIASRLRGAARVHALTVAAFCFYCNGDGTRAGIALDAATAAAAAASVDVPELTTTLDDALRSGTPPSSIRRLVPTFDEVEAATGAQLTGRI